MEQPWFKAPGDLFKYDNLLKFYPTGDMSCAEALNAKSRFVIYAAILALLRNYSIRTVSYVTVGALGVLVATSKCDLVVTEPTEPANVEKMTGIERPDQLKSGGSYLSKEAGEEFAGANEMSQRLMRSTRETPGRTVISSTREERRFRQRPTSTAKGIDSIQYNYLSGAVRHNKYVMNRV